MLSLSSVSYEGVDQHVFVGSSGGANGIVVLRRKQHQGDQDSGTICPGGEFKNNVVTSSIEGRGECIDTNNCSISSAEEVAAKMDKLKDRTSSWKTKRRQARLLSKNKQRQPKAGEGGVDYDKETPVMSNVRDRKRLDPRDARAQVDSALETSSASNLFLQMEDSEVGNHRGASPPSSPAVAESPPRSSNLSTFGSGAAASGSPAGSSNVCNYSDYTPSTDPASASVSTSSSRSNGLMFHPHNAVGPAIDVGVDEQYRSIREQLHSEREAMSPPSRRGKKKEASNKPSPTSVADVMDPARKPSFANEPKRTSRMTAPPSPPSHADLSHPLASQKKKTPPSSKKGGGGGRRPARGGRQSLEQDLSLAPSYDEDTFDSDVMYDDDESAAEDDDESVDNLPTVRDITKAIFGGGAAAPLDSIDRLHDFITGNICWSQGKDMLIERLDDVAGGVTACRDGTKLNDDSLLDALLGTDGEEYSGTDLGDSDTELYETDKSNYTSEESEYRGGGARAKKGKKGAKPAAAKPSRKAQQHQQKKQEMQRQSKKEQKQRSRRQHRRGRSPTEKHGYNSDGESLRSASHSRSRGSARGGSASQSLSTRNSSASGSDRGGRRVLAKKGAKKDRSSSSSSLSSARHHYPRPIDEEGCGSVAETVLSRDQADWMAMTSTKAGGQRDESSTMARMRAAASSSSPDGARTSDGRNASPASSVNAVLSAGGISSIKDRAVAALSKKADVVEGCFKVSLRHLSCTSAFVVFANPTVMNMYHAQKLLTVGIQLLLNDPPSAERSTGPRLNRAGKMYLQFGTRGGVDGKYDHPRLLWTDGQDVSYELEVLDISSINRPAPNDLEGSYPFAVGAHSFFLSTNSGTSLLFEAVDETQTKRITKALRSIVRRLARKIIMGESDWIVQMMLATVGTASGDGTRGVISSLEELEEAAPCAMADATDHMVKCSTLVMQAHDRRRRRR